MGPHSRLCWYGNIPARPSCGGTYEDARRFENDPGEHCLIRDLWVFPGASAGDGVHLAGSSDLHRGLCFRPIFVRFFQAKLIRKHADLQLNPCRMRIVPCKDIGAVNLAACYLQDLRPWLMDSIAERS